MTEFEQLKANLKRYDSEIYIGSLCWYSVFELKVDHKKFCQLLLGNNLGGFLPPPPRGSDVFKRACNEAEIKRDPTSQAGVFRNYQIKEVNKDRDNIWRQLVVETVDSSNRRLHWEVLAELHYDRPNNVITSTLTPAGQAEPRAQEVCSHVSRLFGEWNNAISSQHVRRLIREVFRSVMATAVRPSGGIYFVKKEHAKRIESLAVVMGQLSAGTELHSLPLLDDDQQREMLRKAFEEEQVTEIDRMLGEIAEILGSGATITADKFAKLNGEANYLKSKLANYEQLLKMKIVGVESRLEILNNELFSMVSRLRANRDTNWNPGQ